MKKFSNINIELKDDYILVCLLKDLDFHMAVHTRKAFQYLIEHADRNVKLDLSLSSIKDSSGIGAITYFYKRLKSLDFDLELVGVNNQSLQLMNQLDINKIININSKAPASSSHPKKSR